MRGKQTYGIYYSIRHSHTPSVGIQPISSKAIRINNGRHSCLKGASEG